MRIIDADELKKAIYSDLGLGDEENGVDVGYQSGLQDCYNLIDNVPTISEGLYETYCRMNDAELEHTERLSFSNSKGEIVGFVKERPQGEWIVYKVDGVIKFCKCSLCGRTEEIINFKNYPFCHCGAIMKGGAVV